MRIQTRIAFLLITLSIVVVLGLSVFSTISLDDYFRTQLTDELATQTREAEFIIRTLVASDSARYEHLQRYSRSANLRLTLIDRTGKVLFDSELQQDRIPLIENHLQRPEVQEALRSGTGTSTRHSATINVDLLYLARTISEPFPPESGFADAAILRAAVPLTQVDEVMNGIRSKVIAAGGIVLLLVSAVTLLVARRLSHPIKEMAEISGKIRSGDLTQRIPVRSSDEFGRLAQTLNSMLDKLEEDISKLKKLERVRSEFLGNVSHELRTPIFAVQGMLETLLSGALEERETARNFVERALANTQRLNALLGDLIEISRIESGDMKMSFRYFNLAEFLGNVTAELKPQAAERNITLRCQAPDETLQVLGDKDRLKQVMVNLIENAIKYNRPGGEVTVSSGRSGDRIKISVKDTGVGIPDEHLSRIFERFYRVDKERSREAGGTGLGLAIVKHIVEAHGAKVEVSSEVGRGSTFSFNLGA
jgi:two-component system, OmpR family, phosphate regulon sensor histidine kinase PhoR